MNTKNKQTEKELSIINELSSKYLIYDEEIYFHDVKLLSIKNLVKLNDDRLRKYYIRIQKHISYLESGRILDPGKDLAKEKILFEDYKNMINLLKHIKNN